MYINSDMISSRDDFKSRGRQNSKLIYLKVFATLNENVIRRGQEAGCINNSPSESRPGETFVGLTLTTSQRIPRVSPYDFCRWKIMCTSLVLVLTCSHRHRSFAPIII